MWSNAIRKVKSIVQQTDTLCDNCSEYDEYNECWINREDAVYLDRVGLFTHKDDVIMLDGKWERKNECWYDVKKKRYELINQ